MAQPGCATRIRVGVRDSYSGCYSSRSKKALSFVTSKVVSVDAAETLERTRGNEIFVALLFVNLQFYFGPVFGRFSKGSCNNPTVYVLRFFMGQISFAEAFGGAMVVVFAHVIAFMCYYVLHLHAGEKIYYQLGRQLLPPDHKQKPSSAKRRSRS